MKSKKWHRYLRARCQRWYSSSAVQLSPRGGRRPACSSPSRPVNSPLSATARPATLCFSSRIPPAFPQRSWLQSMLQRTADLCSFLQSSPLNSLQGSSACHGGILVFSALLLLLSSSYVSSFSSSVSSSSFLFQKAREERESNLENTKMETRKTRVFNSTGVAHT